MSLVPFLMATIIYQSETGGSLRWPLGIFVLLMGIGFGAVSVVSFRALASRGGLEIHESSSSGSSREITDPSEKAGVTRMFGLAFGAASLLLLVVSWGILRGPSAKSAAVAAEMEEMPSLPIAPTFALKASRGSAWGYSPLPHFLLPVATARRSALRWTAGTGILILGTAASAVWYPLPFLASLFLGAFCLVGVAICVPLLRTWLALRKVELNDVTWTLQAGPGQPVRIEADVVAVQPIFVRAVRMILVGISQERGGRSRVKRDYFYGAEMRILAPVRLGTGEARRVSGELVLPPDAARSDPSGSVKVCWIAGLVVDLPGWPDLEIGREVRV
jgi:hypothetical protein